MAHDHADTTRRRAPDRGDAHAAASHPAAHPVVWEFLRACEQDPSLGADYLEARDQWHAAATDRECDVADDALVDVLERFTDVRNAALTNAEVQAMRTLRNRPDR